MCKVYSTGGDTWTHGQKMNGLNEWHSFLGPCPDCGSRTFDYGGGWRCIDGYCFRGTSNPAPSVGEAPKWWNTSLNVIKDGNSWMAHNDDFVNLQESLCGFGDTPQEAVEELLKEQLKCSAK